jgi:hypothetical protein
MPGTFFVEAEQRPLQSLRFASAADLREGGTWLIPRDIRLDEGRLILTLTFSTEKSIRSVPKALYGNTDEEKLMDGFPTS